MGNPKNFLQKHFKDLITRYMRSKGYSPYFAYEVFEVRAKDLLERTSIPLRQKIWAQKRGFLSEKIMNYGLTEDNFRDYLSDFDYYKMHPINRNYSHWIDDKLTMKLILKPFDDFLPEYYLHITAGKVLRLSDCPFAIKGNFEDLITLLNIKRTVAMKRLSGTLAEGFFKVELCDGKYYLNKREVILGELEQFFEGIVTSRADYLVTEYLYPHDELKKIWAGTPNTLRVMVIHKPTNNPVIVRAYWRFGSTATGVVDNPAVGGVICDVDVENGIFGNGSAYEGQFLVNCLKHPDTGVAVEGVTPDWATIKEVLVKICCYLPELRYLGFDIIISDHGFKIIEINSHQGIKYLQHYRPLLANSYTREFFETVKTKKHHG